MVGITPDPELLSKLNAEETNITNEISSQYESFGLKIQIKGRLIMSVFDAQSNLTGRIYSFNIAGDKSNTRRRCLYI